MHVRLWHSQDGICFEIADDGVGFALAVREAARQQGHMGLVNIEDRMRAIHGQVAIESAIGRGTKIIGILPLLP